MTAQQYLTFLLRALGYTDGENGTVYDNAFSCAVGAGLREEDPAMDFVCYTDEFWRADMAILSWRTVHADMVTGGRLASKLMESGVFTDEQLSEANQIS